tara:strand:- start:563 stop:853 length:291 start_codon:yes stop_codon:yes gene_type:complete
MNISKIFTVIIFFFILFFYFKVYESYISDKNIGNIKSNRKNVDKILNNNMIEIPVLQNDTNDVIEFNTGYNLEINKKSERKFWDLFKRNDKKSSDN